MQFLDVLTQLNTLPSTYLRPGPQFAEMQSAKAAGLFHFTNASDGLVNQVQSFANATGVWLDAWGKLFGVPRDPDEADNAYATRISAVLTSGCGTPIAITVFIKLSLNIDATITEDFTDTAWFLVLNTPLTPQGYQQLISNLKYVRPAGVPCLKFQENAQGGLFAGTVDFLNAPQVTGAYLKTPSQAVSVTSLSAYTNNSVPLLPTTFLTDPTLNPGL